MPSPIPFLRLLSLPLPLPPLSAAADCFLQPASVSRRFKGESQVINQHPPMPLYKEAPAPPRGPEPVLGPPPPVKITIDESQNKLPQSLCMLTHLPEHAIITPVIDILFGVSGLRNMRESTPSASIALKCAITPPPPFLPRPTHEHLQCFTGFPKAL